jgi:hypothetical protein
MPSFSSAVLKAMFKLLIGLFLLNFSIAVKKRRQCLVYGLKKILSRRLTNQIRSMSVNDCVERQTVAPRCREVTNIDVLVAGSFHLTPKQQSVLSGLCLFVVDLFDGDVLDLESQDDCPNQTQVKLLNVWNCD